MKVTFDCDNTVYPSGTISSLNWHDPALQTAIRSAFYESPGQSIVEIIVQRHGIKAVYEWQSQKPNPAGEK